jgi:exosortase F-associated protein
MADYKAHELPAIHSGRLAFFLSLRYALNMFWSVLVVYFWFGKKDLVRLTMQIMGAAYLVLLPQVVFLSSWATPDQYAWLFYARRLLIHPLLILILLPAYMYYVYEQKKQQKND